METLLYNISQVVGVAIIHSMWQGLFVYLFMQLLLLSFQALPARYKHQLAMLAMGAVTVWFIYTLLGEIRVYQWVAPDSDGANKNIIPGLWALPLHLSHSAAISARYVYTIEGFLPYITLIYVAGLVYNTTRLLFSRSKFSQLRQHISIDIVLMRKLNEFAEKLDIEKRVHFGLSTLIDVPCAFGYFKPFILLPAAIATSLSTEEIETILLHELSHIKRNDYLLNLVQQAMQVLLFFNPFAHLIGRSINRERENACDDMVIASTQKPIVYAHALLKLEQSRTQLGELALAATGKRYHLLNRIERIMKTKKPIGDVRHILLAFVVLTASITGLAWLNPDIAQGKLSFNKIKPEIITSLFADTGHKKSVAKAKQNNSDSNDTTNPSKQKTKDELKKRADQYSSQVDQLNQKYQAEMEKYGEEMAKYYNNGQWKKFQEQMEVYGKQLEDYYNSPEWKKLQEQMEVDSKKIEDFYNSAAWKDIEANQQKLSEEFQTKWAETPETKELTAKMEKTGKDIEHYYNSAEFKALNQRLMKKYGIPPGYKYDFSHNGSNTSKANENFLKYQQELQSQVPPNVKAESDELSKTSAKLSEHFNSPEFRAKSEELRKMSDSLGKMSADKSIKDAQEQMNKVSEQMRAYQNSPELKKIQEEMRQASMGMQHYQNSPELKKLQEQMRITQKKMQEYFNSPEFKKQMEALKNQNWKMDTPDDKTFAPDKPNFAPDKPNFAPDKPDTSGKK